jgi:hypothetical protein
MLRVNVTVASNKADQRCATASAQWELDKSSGFMRSGVLGLCLAAHSVGVFNTEA